ncbi:unnamed protein product [Lupinus luteus]|uniref:Uncharacterized protein n=1 Tax=Lupinus luteus TaxID=3873 RepID=A0AAV1YG46_LUPLU
MTPGSRKPSQSRKGQSWYFCPRSCRLGEILSPGMSLGRGRLAWARKVPPGRERPGFWISYWRILTWARMPRLGENAPLGREFLRLGEDSPMDRNSTHIRGYHFTMSPQGQWSSDGYRYTYTGPCSLKVHMECTGSSMMIPHLDAVIDASFTLPLRRTPTPGGGVSFPPVQNDGAGPSQGRRTWPDVVDAPSSSRAVKSSGRRVGSCKKSPVLRMSTPPNYASGIWHHDMEEEDEEEDEVIELVKVESSVEVIDLVSDSEEEEDPSEGSSIPGIF